MMNEKIDNYSLWEEFKENNNQQARQELILSYLSLVKYQAGRVKMLVPGFIEKEDLESFGIIGLIHAIERFDYKRGIKFSTYATRRIRGAIIDHLRNLDWLSSSLRRKGKEIKKTFSRLSDELGRKPTKKELLEHLDISEDKLDKIYNKLYSAQWLSLQQDMGEGKLFDFIEGNKNQEPEKILDRKEKEKILAQAIDKLPRKEFLVISLYYYEDMTQEEIAKTLELSAARVSQLHKKAIYRLRGHLSSKKQQLAGV